MTDWGDDEITLPLEGSLDMRDLAEANAKLELERLAKDLAALRAAQGYD